MSCTTDAYTRHPGKFEASGEIGESLYEMSLAGGCDAEVPHPWRALLLNTGLPCAPNAILWETEPGFIDYEAFDTEAEARGAFEEYEREFERAEVEEFEAGDE